MAQKRALEGFDDMAWMIGSYVGQAYHQPKKYPKKPSMVKRDLVIPDTEMEPDDMKDALMIFAQAHNKEVANGGDAGRITD